MLSWKDVAAQQAHCRDLQREAERERLAAEVRNSSPKASPLYRSVVTWLLHRLEPRAATSHGEAHPDRAASPMPGHS